MKESWICALRYLLFVITLTDPVAHSAEAKIRTFGLPGMPAVINHTDKTIDWSVTYASDPKHLAAEFSISDGATAYSTNPGLANPMVITSGTERDFSEPVHYWVQSSLGEIADYTVTVHHFTGIGLATTMQSGPWNDWSGLNHNRMLVSAVLAGHNTYTPIITLSGLDAGHAYDLYIASRIHNENHPTDFAIGGSIKHLANPDGTATDWTDGESYVHFANVIPQPDGSLVVKGKGDGYWAGICVNGFQLRDMGVRSGLNTEAFMYSMTFPGVGPAIISGTDVSVTVPYGTSLMLAPTYVASVGATGAPAAGVSTDFTSTVPYIITSEDGGTTTTYNVTVTVAPPPPGGTSVGPVCWYDAGDGITVDGSGLIQTWNDLSGFAHHGTPQDGNPALVADQLNGKPAAQLRGQCFNLAGTFFAKEQYVVVRSPHTDAWGAYGAFLGRAAGRNSSYLLTPENTTMWNDQSAQAVSKNGLPVPKNQNNNYIFDLAPINEYMLLKIIVNDNDPNAAAYQIGRADGMSCDMDIAEIIAYDGPLSQVDENLLGAYFADKYGLTITFPSTTPIVFGPTGTGTLTFGALPSKSEWSTMSIAGGGGTITNLTEMNGLVNTFAASDFTDQLGTVSADPVGATTVLGQWNSLDLRLTDRAGTTAATCFMASLRNDSGVALNEFDLSFTLLGSGADDELPGYVLYCSLTGEPDSWQQIGSFSTLGTVTASNIPLTTPWASGAALYVLWVHDNGNGVGDNWYGFDDVTFAKSGGSADPFTTWINANYPSLSDKTPGGDPDGDGVSNQAEFAFGLNPSLGSSCNPITAQLNKSTGQFSYIRRDPALTGLAYTVWTSTNLLTWAKDTIASAGQAVTATDGEVQTVGVTLSAAAVNGKLFVRVQAE
jgi:hypothetical protein